MQLPVFSGLQPKNISHSCWSSDLKKGRSTHTLVNEASIISNWSASNIVLFYISTLPKSWVFTKSIGMEYKEEPWNKFELRHPWKRKNGCWSNDCNETRLYTCMLTSNTIANVHLKFAWSFNHCCNIIFSLYSSPLPSHCLRIRWVTFWVQKCIYNFSKLTFRSYKPMFYTQKTRINSIRI